MLNPREALEVLDRDFLETRGQILEIAAVLDRIDRAPAHHHLHPDPRAGQIRQALEALCEPGPGRSETIQLIFSLEYDQNWRRPPEIQAAGPVAGHEVICRAVFGPHRPSPDMSWLPRISGWFACYQLEPQRFASNRCL